MSKNVLSQIRCTAAEILAAAINDCVPKAILIRGGDTLWGFYYDFISVHPFSKEMLIHIEERMRAIIAEDGEIKVHEMVPMSAIEFLRHHRRTYPILFVQQSSDPLVQIFQLGSFVDYVDGAFLERAGELKAVKLLSVERRPDLLFKGEAKSVYRIIGAAAPSSQELKEFLREKKREIGKTHLDYGKELELFKVEITRADNYLEEGQVYWEKAGEELLYRLYSFWRDAHLKENFNLVVTGEIEVGHGHKKLYDLTAKNEGVNPVRYAEYRFPIPGGGFDPLVGLLDTKNSHYDQAHIFCLKKHLELELKSSLKFLEKTLKILELEHSMLISYPEEYEELFTQCGLKGKITKGKEARIEWIFSDGYRRPWKGSFLTIKKKENLYTIKRSIFPSLERVIALILESPEKDLSQKKELFSRIAPIDE